MSEETLWTSEHEIVTADESNAFQTPQNSLADPIQCAFPSSVTDQFTRTTYTPPNSKMDHFPKNMSNAISTIRQHMATNVFEWDSFQPTPPSSAFADFVNEDSKPVLFQNFQNNNELQNLAGRDLSSQQRAQLRKTGAFDVPSEQFKGAFYTWKVTRLLQSGTNNIWKTFQATLIQILATFVYRIPIAIRESSKVFKGVGWGLVRLLDTVFGLRWKSGYTSWEVDSWIQRQAVKYLYRAVTLQPKFIDYLEDRDRQHLSVKGYSHIPDAFRLTVTNGNSGTADSQSASQQGGTTSSSSSSGTPFGVSPDFVYTHLGSDEIQSAVEEVLDPLLISWNLKWEDEAHQLTVDITTKLKDEEGLSALELQKKVADTVEEVKFERYLTFLGQIAESTSDPNNNSSSSSSSTVQASVTHGRRGHHKVKYGVDPTLQLSKATDGNVREYIWDKIGQLLRVHRKLEDCKLEMEDRRQTAVKNYTQRLKENHKIRSLIDEWVNDKVSGFLSNYDKEQHMSTLEYLKSPNVLAVASSQEKYIIQQHVDFTENHEQGLRTEREKVRWPARVFTFQYRIWNPKNWKIIKSSSPDPYYYAVKTQTTKFSTASFGWRFKMWWYRLKWIFNDVSYWLVVSLFFGPASLRALFACSPWTPETIVERKTGRLIKNQNKKFVPFISYFRSLWSQVNESVRKFEAAPQGLIPRGVSRFFHRLWAYVILGLLGSLAILTVIPIGIILNVLLCSMGLVCMPAISLIGATLASLFDTFIFDTAFPRETGTGTRANVHFKVLPVFSSILSVLLPPIGYPLAVLFSAIVVPILSVVVFLLAFIKFLLNHVWDALVYIIVLRGRTKVPNRDGFLARRTAGPGVASSYYLQVAPSHILVMLRAQLELTELSWWERCTDSYMDTSQQSLSHFLATYWPALGIPADSRFENSTTLFNRMHTKENKYKHHMNLAIKNRRNFLHRLVSRLPCADMIRLREDDLNYLVSTAVGVVRDVHTSRIEQYLVTEENQAEMWSGMRQRNWQDMTEHLLTGIVSHSILVPLEEDDQVFKLEVDHVTVSRMLGQVLGAKHVQEDLEVAAPCRQRVAAAKASPSNPVQTAPWHYNDTFNVPLVMNTDVLINRWREEKEQEKRELLGEGTEGEPY